MLKKYSITYICEFDHEDEENLQSCTARILFHDKSLSAFEFQTTLYGTKNIEPVIYALGGYSGTNWIVNITDKLMGFITNPLDIQSTIDDLEEIEIDPEEAEELATVIQKLSTDDYTYLEPASPLLPSDDNLPF